MILRVKVRMGVSEGGVLMRIGVRMRVRMWFESDNGSES